MEYIYALKDYIYSFFPESEDSTFVYSIQNFNAYKPKFTYSIIDNIDFVNTRTSDIVIFLNDVKSKYSFSYDECETIYDLNVKDKLVKLKYMLINCLMSKKDTTDAMYKHICKYKGENIIYLHKEEVVDKEYEELNRRYIELISNKDEDDDDNEEDDD